MKWAVALMVTVTSALAGAACGEGDNSVVNQRFTDATAEIQFHIRETLSDIDGAPPASGKQVALCRAARSGLADVLDANASVLDKRPPTEEIGALQLRLLDAYSTLLTSCIARDRDVMAASAELVADANAELGRVVAEAAG